MLLRLVGTSVLIAGLAGCGNSSERQGQTESTPTRHYRTDDTQPSSVVTVQTGSGNQGSGGGSECSGVDGSFCDLDGGVRDGGDGGNDGGDGGNGQRDCNTNSNSNTEFRLCGNGDGGTTGGLDAGLRDFPDSGRFGDVPDSGAFGSGPDSGFDFDL